MYNTNESGIVEFPNGYLEKDYSIYDDSGKKVTNGLIRLLGYYNVIRDDSSCRMIQVHFFTSNGEVDTKVNIPVSIIDSKKLLQYTPDGFFFFIDSEIKRLRLFQNLLKLTIEKLSLSEIYMLHPGYNKLLDGSYVYGLGSTVLNQRETIRLEVANMDKIKPLTRDRIPFAEWINCFFHQSESHPALFISATVSLIQPLLSTVDINNIFAIYVVGETGKGKSEYAKLLTDIFETHGTCRSLSSSQMDLLRDMEGYSDFLFLIDDLNKTASQRVKDKKEAVLSELIQQVSSGGKIKCRGELFRANAMLLITAEYILKNNSTINRCLIITLEENFNPEKLSWLQSHQYLYILFLLDYITWICQEYSQITKYIHSWISGNKPLVVEVPESYAGLQRVKRTYNILQIATELYLLFLKQKLFTPEPSIKRLRTQIMSSIDNCINTTLEKIKKENPDSGICYVHEIFNAILFYGSGAIAASYHEYQNARKNSNKTPKKIFFIEGDCYCITGEDLSTIFSSLNDFPYTCSKKAISAQLRYHGLLKIKGGEYSFPLNGNRGKRRYYHLYIKRINEMIQDIYTPMELDTFKKMYGLPGIE